MSFNAPRGVVAPILTPFNDDLTIATDLYVDLANRLLDEGCAGFAPFGTTGEALSVGIDERIDGIRSLIDGGIDPSLLIPGTGLTDVAEPERAVYSRGRCNTFSVPTYGFFSTFFKLLNSGVS